MKNKLNKNNVINVYHYAGAYVLHFVVDNKNVYLKNIEKKHYPKAEFDEWYFNDENVLEEVIKDIDEEDIEVMEIIR